VDRHRLVGEELQNRQLVDDAAGDRLDVLDVDPLRAGDLGLYDVAGEERGVVVVGDSRINASTSPLWARERASPSARSPTYSSSIVPSSA